MKSVIASDIHGSSEWCERLMSVVGQEQPDYLILLGDLLYHGPRNPLPDGYAPKEVARMLNEHAEKIIAIRGNCDSEVDQMMLDFPCMADYALVIDGDTRLYCTHGHLHSPDAPPQLPKGTVFLSGHTHVKTDILREGLRFVNPGSISLPKDGTHSYALCQNGMVELRELG